MGCWNAAHRPANATAEQTANRAAYATAYGPAYTTAFEAADYTALFETFSQTTADYSTNATSIGTNFKPYPETYLHAKQCPLLQSGLRLPRHLRSPRRRL